MQTGCQCPQQPRANQIPRICATSRDSLPLRVPDARDAALNISTPLIIFQHCPPRAPDLVRERRVHPRGAGGSRPGKKEILRRKKRSSG
jgi:hypothetical protein